MKGNLNTISDLLKIPGWGDKKFERFVCTRNAKNFVKPNSIRYNNIFFFHNYVQLQLIYFHSFRFFNDDFIKLSLILDTRHNI